MISGLKDFFTRRIWEINVENLPRLKAFAIRSIRILIISVYSFIEHKSSTHASVLTYYSILNIVPLVAVVFAIAKGFGLDRFVENQIRQIAENSNWQTDVTEQILEFSRNFLEQAKGGIIAGVGIVLLLWTVISILGKIEESLNRIWEVKKERTILRKFTDYMAILILAPVLFAISSSLMVLVTGKIEFLVQRIELLGFFSTFITFILKVFSYVSLWTLLTVVYVIMPNAKVPIRSAILGSIVAGTLIQIVQWIYITFQIGVAKYGAVYGSLAALPLLFGWLQTSWMILLFGLEISHANEHCETYGLSPASASMSIFSEKIIMLTIFKLIVKQFSSGEKPLSAIELSRTLKIPLSIVQKLLGKMKEAHIVAEVADEHTSSGYQPARSVETLTIADIMRAYEDEGMMVLSRCQSDEIKKISEHIQRLYGSIENLPENVPIKDL